MTCFSVPGFIVALWIDAGQCLVSLLPLDQVLPQGAAEVATAWKEEH